MKRKLLHHVWCVVGTSLAVTAATTTLRCQALTLLPGMTFSKATNAPLAGMLRLTTDEESRVEVTVEDGSSEWQRRFYDYGTNHSVPLLGFKPGRTNEITVAVYDRHRNRVTAEEPLVFVTDPLPANFPRIALLHSEPDRMEPGYTLFRVSVHNETYWYGTIVDPAGEVVWYGTVPSTADLRRLDNGNLFMPWTNRFVEMNLLGETVRTWNVQTNLPINLHDGVPTDHGTILYLANASQVLSNYPTSMTTPKPKLATASVRYEKVVELSVTNAAVLKTWSPVNQLDPRRISYMIVQSAGGWDSEHSNAIIEDPRDDSIIMSMRHQNAVIKFSRTTGQLRWILGPPANWGAQWQPYLLKPVGTPFVWQYAQHTPILTPQGTLLLYDNGNYRASPFATKVSDANNYSRVVEYSINEETKEVTQVWDYGRVGVAERLYTDHGGSVEWEPTTGNVLIDFAAVLYSNGAAPSSYGPSATMVRITEVTHDEAPQIVFDLAISMFSNTNVTYKDTFVYRSHRIPDLYAHPAKAVTDLTLSCADGVPHLEFSADDTRTYFVESSTDLLNWEAVGQAWEGEAGTGDFVFDDGAWAEAPARYYRVVTQ